MKRFLLAFLLGSVGAAYGASGPSISGTGGVGSNYVYNMIVNYSGSPTGGITATQGTNIANAVSLVNDIALSNALMIVSKAIQINVKDAPYLATGDGTTDDTASIQSAIDYGNSVGGAKIYFPAGQYSISNRLIIDATWPTCLQLRSNTFIVGDGPQSVLIVATNSGQPSPLFMTSSNDFYGGLMFSDITLDGNLYARRAAQGLTGDPGEDEIVNLKGGTNIFFSRVIFRNAGQNAIDIDSQYSGAGGLRVSDCQFYACYAAPIHDALNNTVVQNCYFWSNGWGPGTVAKAGVNLLGSRSSVVNCTFEDNLIDIYLNLGASAVIQGNTFKSTLLNTNIYVISPANSVIIANNQFNSAVAGQVGLSFSNAEAATVTGNRFGFSGVGALGVVAYNSGNLQIANNYFGTDGSAGRGVLVTGNHAASKDGVSITDNFFSHGAVAAAVESVSVTNLTVANNRFWYGAYLYLSFNGTGTKWSRFTDNHFTTSATWSIRSLNTADDTNNIFGNVGTGTILLTGDGNYLEGNQIVNGITYATTTEAQQVVGWNQLFGTNYAPVYVWNLKTNGGTPGQIPTLQLGGNVTWSNAPAGGGFDVTVSNDYNGTFTGEGSALTNLQSAALNDWGSNPLIVTNEYIDTYLFQNDGTRTAVIFPYLLRITNLVTLDNLTAARTVYAPLLQFGQLTIANTTGLTNVNLPSLLSCGTALNGASLNLTENADLLFVNLPRLTNCPSFGIAVSTGNKPTLVVHAPLLQTATDIFLVDFTGAVALDFPSLTHTKDFDVSGTEFLVSANFPNLVKSDGDMYFNSNTNLTEVNLPVFLPDNGQTITFQDSALSRESVNQILSRAVAAGMTSGTIALNNLHEVPQTNALPHLQGAADFRTLTNAGVTVTINEGELVFPSADGTPFPLYVDTVVLTNGSGVDGHERDLSVITNYNDAGLTALQFRTAATHTWLYQDNDGYLHVNGAGTVVDQGLTVTGLAGNGTAFVMTDNDGNLSTSAASGVPVVKTLTGVDGETVADSPIFFVPDGYQFVLTSAHFIPRTIVGSAPTVGIINDNGDMTTAAALTGTTIVQYATQPPIALTAAASADGDTINVSVTAASDDTYVFDVTVVGFYIAVPPP